MTFLMNSFLQPHVHELARDNSFYKNDTALVTYTSDARAIGVASATRRVYALIFGSRDNSGTLSSVTIGGVAATIHVQNSGFDPGRPNLVAIASATVPTGITAVVVFTFTALFERAACAVIALDNLNSITPVGTISTNAEDSAEVSGQIDCVAWGYLMAIACGDTAEDFEPTCTWTGAQESADDYINDGGSEFDPMSFAYVPITPAEANRTITATYNDPEPPEDNKTLVAITVR